MTVIVSIFLLSIVASLIQRTTGFGFGIFIMTMLPFLMPSYAEATTLTGLLAMSNSIYIAIRMHRYVQWRRVVPILCAFVVVSTLSIFCLKKIDDVVLRDVLGVVLILFSIYFWFFNKKIRLRPTLPTQIGTGVLSGLMGGFFNMQGPPAVLYFISTAKDKNQYMALAQVYISDISPTASSDMSSTPTSVSADSSSCSRRRGEALLLIPITTRRSRTCTVSCLFDSETILFVRLILCQ